MFCKISYKNDEGTFYTVLRCGTSSEAEFKDFMNNAIRNGWQIVDVKFGENLF